MITTYGDHAAGFQAQSGGGGKGGAAISFVGGLLPTVAVGVGGPARDVYITNGAQVTTYGPDAPGVLMQSIGGGGGTGGAAAAALAAWSCSTISA